MSERWGACPRCHGRGVIEVVKKDLILFRTETVEQECGRCEGTGHDGSAFAPDAPWLAGDDDV